MFLEECEIIENIKISEDKYLLKLKSEKSSEYAKVGQFFMIKCEKYLFVFYIILIYYHYEDFLKC